MKTEETILIPIKASEEKPIGDKVVKTNLVVSAYYDYEDEVWRDDRLHEIINIEFWYKPISKKEYLSQKIEGLLPTTEEIKCDYMANFDYKFLEPQDEMIIEWAYQYINYIKEQIK